MDLNLHSLYRALFADIGVDKKTSVYLLRRLRNEGVKVVTHLLPAFSKHVLACIESGFWSSFDTSIRCKGGLPVIFRGYLFELFTYDIYTKQYVVRVDACPVALYIIRQACEYCYKLALPFTDEQLASASEKFESVDATVLGVGEYDYPFVDKMRANFETHYKACASLSLNDIGREAHPGPGTYSGSDPEEYWMRNYWHPTVPAGSDSYAHGLRLNKRSPRAINSGSVGLDRFNYLSRARSRADGIFKGVASPVAPVDPNYSEVLFVPKDSRGPRTIMREPYSKLLFQMGYNTCLSRALERDTMHRVNFARQDINQSLAHKSSIDRSMSTLDLKDASDRVSHAITEHVLRHTRLSKALDLWRTKECKLPSGKKLRLRKLSGMGSGFTFPTMALIIHLAICTQVSVSRGIGYRHAMQRVYVYGDDIIIPTGWFDLAIFALKRIGLEVNPTKSYTRSYFRESCGGDYFRGNDVAPVRLKLSSAQPRATGYTISSAREHFWIFCLERHARELVSKQLYEAASYIYNLLESRLGPLPLVSLESPILGRLSDRDSVLDTVSYDSTGTSRMTVQWVAIPRDGSVRNACPYQHLKKQLGKVAESRWSRDLFPAGSSVQYGTATVPRRIEVRRRKICDFARA